jgi:uncharacterized protein
MSGKLSPALAEAILETLPLEMTLIDENDRIVWWNTRRERVFARPEEVRGRDVRSCHNAESNRMIDRLLREMKAGEREVVRMWFDRAGADGAPQKLLIEYLAVRDGGGRYLGCIETLQDVAPLRALEGERKTLDD